jgi:hypothetical protein
MTELDVPVTDGPGIEHEPTAPAAPTPSAPKRRVSRVLVAGLVATTLALGGAAYFEQSASADRDEAVLSLINK